MGMIFNQNTCRYEYVPDYMPQQPKTTPQPNSQGLLWVSGEVGAKSWVVPPNSTVLLMDSESNHFYIKSSDNAGMPSLKTYEYKEIVKQMEPAQTQENTSLIEEVNELKRQVNELTEQIQSIKEHPKIEKKEVKNE